MDDKTKGQRSYYYQAKSVFWGCDLPMESQPYNPEFMNNPEYILTHAYPNIIVSL